MDQKKKEHVSIQEGAGSLLLMAAAQQTGLLCQLETAIQASSDPAGDRVQESSQAPEQEQPLVLSPVGPSRSLPSQRKLVATLLFLSAVGLHRPWDLRSYSGDALGLLVGRKRAYSYGHIEQFLAAVAKTDAVDRFTDAVGLWTCQLWHAPLDRLDDCYVDGHHKPVYSQRLIPRGLIGRTHQILGCRGLMLLHDQHGHPRLVLTGRGDWHVMDGLCELVSRYEQITGHPIAGRIVVDREGMGATFLKKLADEGRCIVTLLRSNQYTGPESFSDVGAFVPLTFDSHGLITREVAPARFALSLPESAQELLEVQVALIRDLRACPAAVGCDGEAAALLMSGDDGQAHPNSREPRLIPIITTDPGPLDAASLAASYIHRWAAQENVIKDYLLPLGLDTNHGFAKTPVVNSEVEKKREIAQKHLETFKKWMASSLCRCHQMICNKVKLIERIERDENQYLLLDISQHALDRNCLDYMKRYNKIQKKKDIFSIQQEKRKVRLQKLSLQISEYHEKCQYYAQKQRDLVRSLEDLEKNERIMYELDNRKDHVMTVFKVALANLAMWTRDQYFPDTYSAATWERLAPFFRLPGIIRSNQQTVSVSLRPFNDRQYNRDLHLLCQRVNQKQPHLPDGRLLQFSVLSAGRLILNGHTLQIA
jgi:hypothetical protein